MEWGGRAAIAACIALGALGAAPPIARAEAPPALLCGRDEVLRIVERTVRRWNRYNHILDGTAAEAPTEVANSVVCHATMASVAYESTPEGWIPRRSEERRRYDVQVVGNRLFVQVQP